VNNLLVLSKNVSAALKDVHALVGAMAHGKDTLEHLQEVGVSTGGGGDTTATGMTRRGNIHRRRGVAID
jgi:hypothetical protein